MLDSLAFDSLQEHIRCHAQSANTLHTVSSTSQSQLTSLIGSCSPAESPTLALSSCPALFGPGDCREDSSDSPVGKEAAEALMAGTPLVTEETLGDVPRSEPIGDRPLTESRLEAAASRGDI